MANNENQQQAYLMNDRKWLNLVIFLISAMIILFLILQKKMEMNTFNPDSQIRTNSNITLLTPSYDAEILIVNGRWIPVEQLLAELSLKKWTDFLIAWKTVPPEVSLSTLPNSMNTNKIIELKWVSDEQQLPFKLYKNDTSLVIQFPNASKIMINHYNAEQSQLLLPNWLIELAQ